MKKTITAILAAAAIGLVSVSSLAAGNSADVKAIEQVLTRYESFLNASDADEILTLYKSSAVFMPQHSSPMVGHKAITAAYKNVFTAIKLDIDFVIDEIEHIAPNWAYARTRSKGFVTINATGDKVAEGNQELFLLEKNENDEWKIARYIFSTTNPPRQ